MSELQFLSQVIDAKADRIKSLAREIWGYAELAYEEEKSAAALEQALASEGFTIERASRTFRRPLRLPSCPAAANRWRPSSANTMRWRS